MGPSPIRNRRVRAAAAVLFAVALGCSAAAATAPPQEARQPQRVAGQNEIVATVQALFDAMAARDVAAMEALLVPEGRVIAMRGDAVHGTPGGTSNADFIAAIVASEGQLLERMWDPAVREEGPIAMLWAPYDFHRDGEFSHCGVDHVSLVRTDSGWKIAGITYTVQREGCEPSPLGPPR